MAVTELAQTLKEIPGVRVRAREPMSRHVPLRLGGPVQLWVVAEHTDALANTLRATRKAKVGWRVHWPFEDLLVRDGMVSGVVIRPAWTELSVDGDHVRLSAATPFSALVGLGPEGWWSGLARWPGTPGGLFARNEQGWLTGMCARVRWLTGRGFHSEAVDPGEAPPSPPDSAVLLDVELRPGLRPALRRGRSRPPGPGSLFAEPKLRHVQVGGLLSRDNLLGTRLRSWRLSETEPGTVINRGGGTCADLMLLVRGVRDGIEKKCGVRLDMRLPILGSESGLSRGGR